MTTVDVQSFESSIKAAKTPVILIFVTEWSVTSSQMTKRAGELDPSKYTVLRVDVDKTPSLAMRFSIRQVPWVVKMLSTGELLAAGQVLAEVVG